MDTKLLFTFIALNIINVILQTIKSICTIKGGKFLAASANAIAFGLYTIVIVYMVADLPLLIKVFVVAICNFIGVFVVKFAEEKSKKDKLWKVEATINNKQKAYALIEKAKQRNLSFNYIFIEKYIIFNFYCPTQKDSVEVKQLLQKYNAKYFVTETKDL